MPNKDGSRSLSAIAVVGMSLLQIGVGQIGHVRASALQVASHAPGEADRGPLAPGEINLATSRVYIFVDKTGFGHQHAVGGRLREGNMRPSRRAAGRMVFDMASFRADGIEARRRVGLKGEIDQKTQEDVTATMLSADILDVGRFPTASFEIHSLQPIEARSKSGKLQYRFDGEFTLHGTTRPLRFTAEGVAEKGYLRFKGSFRLRQTDYKIPPYKKALGTVGVADVLTVYGDLFVKQ